MVHESTNRPTVPLSVRVISYKYDKWLPQCLDGIEQQSVQPVEVVVSDDSSPPPHGQAFQDLAPQFPWARFQSTPANIGAVAHMRWLLAEIPTRYYLLLSADDWLVDPHFLRDAVALLDANPSVIAVSGQNLPVDPQGQILRSKAPTQEPLIGIVPALQMRDLLAIDNVVPAVCTVVRTSVHEQIPPFPLDNALCHDWMQWYLMTFQGDFAVIGRTAVHYRVHPQSLSSQLMADSRAARLTNEMYLQLLQQPQLSAHDRQMLRAGQIRKRMRFSRFPQLWRAVWQAPLQRATWLALTDTLTERVASRLDRVRLTARPKNAGRQHEH